MKKMIHRFLRNSVRLAVCRSTACNAGRGAASGLLTLVALALASRADAQVAAVSNQPVANLTTTSAVFHGWVISTGASETAVCVLWGQDTNAWANTYWWPAGSWAGGSYPATNITGLASNTTYYYAFAASNAAGMVTSAPPVSFKTLGLIGGWWRNPALKYKEDSGAVMANGGPHFMSKDESGQYLFFPSGFDPKEKVALYRISDLIAATSSNGVAPVVSAASTNFYTTGWPDAWRGGGVSDDLGLIMPGNFHTTRNTTLPLIPPWTKNVNVFTITNDSGSILISALSFSHDSSKLYSCMYSDSTNANTSKVWVWNVGNLRTNGVGLTTSTNIQTSASYIHNLSDYYIGGRDILYYGDGNTGTTVYAYDTVAGTETCVISNLPPDVLDPDNGSNEIVNVKVGGIAAGQMHLYVQLSGGALYVYDLAADGKSVGAVVKSFSVADMSSLLGVASWPNMRCFEVTDDESYAFLSHHVTTSGNPFYIYVVQGSADIQNRPATDVTAIAAALNGYLGYPGASAASVGVLWGTTDGGLSGAWANTNWFDGTWPAGSTFSTNITGLTNGTVYYYTYFVSNAEGVVRAGPSISFLTGGKTWTGASNVDWSVGANWTDGTAPTEADDVRIPSFGRTRDPLLNLSGGITTIKALTIYGGTLTITNGDLSAKYLRVSNDVTIASNATVTHAAETVTSGTVGSENQRMYLAVGGNMTIAADGKIDVTGKGYQGNNNGPGAPGGNTAGAAYGGEGQNGSLNPSGATYGSATNPVNSGSSGGPYNVTGGSGGGTVVLSVGGLLTLNGSILSEGNTFNGGGVSGGGAGGSVNIKAGSLAGNGTISANGGYNTTGGGCGGGGRIAVVLTNADDSAFAGLAVIRAYGSLDAAGGYDPRGGAGTVFLNATNLGYGKLIVDNNNRYGNPAGQPATGDWVQPKAAINETLLVSTIICTNYGLLKVGTGGMLDLRQGCVLYTQTNVVNAGWSGRSLRNNRIIIGANQVLWPATYTLSNAVLSIAGTNEVSLPTNLVIAAGGVLSHEGVKSAGTSAEDHMLKVSIVSNLTIDAGGVVDVTGLGYFSGGYGPGGGSGGNGASHGGQGGGSSSGTTYDSVTNPVRSGSAGNNSGGTAGRPGGGCAVLSIGGDLALNGSILADGPLEAVGEAASSGSGGSVNITGGSLSGNGTISANGGGSTSGGSQGGGGGRIAVVLTNASDSAFSALASILAYGGRNEANSQFGAAGTVCLKGTNTAYGRLTVDNNGRTPYLGKTLIGSSVTDTSVGDVVIRNSANLSISAQTLTAYGSWSNAVAMSTNASAAYGGTVVLAGTSPATVWGGNTWSNLTIVTAGKTVNFQAGVTQTVYGIPGFSNVTLQSTASGSYWYLQKPGSGTQEVGVVTVQDSNATNGWTFGAAPNSVNKGNNVNWLFRAPKGTVLMVW